MKHSDQKMARTSVQWKSRINEQFFKSKDFYKKSPLLALKNHKNTENTGKKKYKRLILQF